MIYERNPVRCKFERRLEVSTSPLNIIYNPQAIKKVTEFFYKGRVHTSGKSSYLCAVCDPTDEKDCCYLFIGIIPCSYYFRVWLSVRAGAEGGRSCQEAVQQVKDADQSRDSTDYRSASRRRVHCESDPLDGWDHMIHS